MKPAERRLLVRASVALLATDVQLRLNGFRKAADRVPTTAEASIRPRPDDLVRARGYARSLELASRYGIVWAHCLHRALVLHRWLRREGLSSTLRIGVRKDGSALKAHAWVELQGEVIGDRAEDVARFVPLSGPMGEAVVWSAQLQTGAPVRSIEGMPISPMGSARALW